MDIEVHQDEARDLVFQQTFAAPAGPGGDDTVLIDIVKLTTK